VWDDGVLSALPTLGGLQGFATGVNDRGQVVGWAETPVHDPTCTLPQVLQFRAVLWEPTKGKTQELPPLDGDSASAATAINERGQAVGISGDCDVAVGRFSARHAVLWEHGRVTEIPNLGGTSWHTPMAINDRGDIVGFSNPPDNGDGTFLAHAFLLPKSGKITDLGTLSGDATSQAMGINSRRQVVGVSSGTVNRAFLWQNGVLMNLNDLVGPGFADSLVSAQDINEAGQITGRVFERSTGKTLTFVATPKWGRS
jgi:probable HAF family extracellular repeat protein